MEIKCASMLMVNETPRRLFVAPAGTDVSILFGDGFWKRCGLSPGHRVEVMEASGAWYAEFVVIPDSCSTECPELKMLPLRVVRPGDCERIGDVLGAGKIRRDIGGETAH